MPRRWKNARPFRVAMLLGKVLKYYGENTSLHGLKYVADERKSLFSRTLWTIIFALSTVGMLRIFKGSYDSFRHNAISFVTETTYLDWNTTFPAISVCETSSSEIFLKTESNESFSQMQQFLSDLVFFTGSCYSCNADCDECERINYREMVNRFRKKCTQLMKECSWNGMAFNCCDKFQALETEYGVCYTINSLHSVPRESSGIVLRSNRWSGPGELSIVLTEDARIYIHSPEDVPFINSDPDLRRDVILGETYSLLFSVVEIENDENVKAVPVEKRGCRFPWETTDDLRVHSFYSYSSCIVQCHADAHYDLCNCTHHLMPVLGEESHCDRKGLRCLTQNFETVNRLHARGFDKLGLVCECVPSCVEPEYKIISENKGAKRPGNSQVTIKMQALPTSRFKRNVVRTTMDLVVSIGGTAGLFIGASLLSIIETVYLLLFRGR